MPGDRRRCALVGRLLYPETAPIGARGGTTEGVGHGMRSNLSHPTSTEPVRPVAGRKLWGGIHCRGWPTGERKRANTGEWSVPSPVVLGFSQWRKESRRRHLPSQERVCWHTRHRFEICAPWSWTMCNVAQVGTCVVLCTSVKESRVKDVGQCVTHLIVGEKLSRSPVVRGGRRVEVPHNHHRRCRHTHRRLESSPPPVGHA